MFFDQSLRRFNGLHESIPICVSGTWGVEFFGEVQPEAEDLVVTKRRFGGFESTDLDLVLRSNRIKTLVFTGGITQVCVESTVARPSPGTTTRSSSGTRWQESPANGMRTHWR